MNINIAVKSAIGESSTSNSKNKVAFVSFCPKLRGQSVCIGIRVSPYNIDKYNL